MIIQNIATGKRYNTDKARYELLGVQGKKLFTIIDDREDTSTPAQAVTSNLKKEADKPAEKEAEGKKAENKESKKANKPKPDTGDTNTDTNPKSDINANN